MKRGGPLQRRTPLHSSKPLREVVGSAETGKLPRTTIPRRSTLKGRSEKVSDLWPTYVAIRDAFLTDFNRCEHPDGCDQWATQVQHRYGRNGNRLIDYRWFAASCERHNTEAETKTTGRDLDNGWLVRLNSKNHGQVPWHADWTPPAVAA